MGKLVDGEWVDAPERGHDDQGFTEQIIDPRNHPAAKYPAESGRYHLYISRACPWAHRTALDLRYDDQPREATHEEIAEILGSAPGTVSTHLQKAEAKPVHAVIGAIG